MTSTILPRLDLPLVLVLLGDRSPATVARCQGYVDELRALGVRTVARTTDSPDLQSAAAACRIGLLFGVAGGPTARRIRNGIVSVGGLTLADADSALAGCSALVAPHELPSLWRQRYPEALVPVLPADETLRLALLLGEPRADDNWQCAVVRLAERLVALGHAVTAHVVAGRRFAGASDAGLAAFLRGRLGARRIAVRRGWEPSGAHAVLATDRNSAACAAQLSGVGHRVLLHEDDAVAGALAQALGLTSAVLGGDGEATAGPPGAGALLRLSRPDRGAAETLVEWLRSSGPTGVAPRGRQGALSGEARPRACLDNEAAAAGATWLLASGSTVAFVVQPQRDGPYRIDLQLANGLASAAGRLVLTVREHPSAPEYLAISTVACSAIVAGLWTSFEFPSLVAVAGSRLHVTLTLLDAGPDGRVELGLASGEAEPTEPSGIRAAYRLYALEPAGRYGSLATVVMADWLMAEEASLWRREAAWRQFRASREYRLLRAWWWASGALPAATERPWPPDAARVRRLLWALRFCGPRAAMALLLAGQ